MSGSGETAQTTPEQPAQTTQEQPAQTTPEEQPEQAVPEVFSVKNPEEKTKTYKFKKKGREHEIVLYKYTLYGTSKDINKKPAYKWMRMKKPTYIDWDTKTNLETDKYKSYVFNDRDEKNPTFYFAQININSKALGFIRKAWRESCDPEIDGNCDTNSIKRHIIETLYWEKKRIQEAQKIGGRKKRRKSRKKKKSRKSKKRKVRKSRKTKRRKRKRKSKKR